MNKITIVGAGSVGATIAYKLASDMIASEIVLVDVRSEKALGEAMDIRQGMAFIGKVNIYAGSYEDAKGSDIVIITSGVARQANQTRLELAKVNVGIAMDIMPKIAAAAPDAKYIIVSNPVDVITYAFIKYSGLPANHIIGSGTILDTTRLRERICRVLHRRQPQRPRHGAGRARRLLLRALVPGDHLLRARRRVSATSLPAARTSPSRWFTTRSRPI